MKLLVGTKKGAFIYESDTRREKWRVSEPILTGWTVYHMAADTRRETPRLYAAANHWAWGPSVAKSDDHGTEWDWKSPGLAFPKDMGVTVQNVWEVAPGGPGVPGVVYAGVQPAGLFRSEDWGANWAPVDALNRHPGRDKWSGTGGGDSCVNSIEIHPRDARHMYAVVSAGGAFVTKDGGATWEECTHNVVPTTQMALAFNAE
ncbi:MAG: exo-alpha-sialidase, partial [Dehalococcoidia bacterium]